MQPRYVSAQGEHQAKGVFGDRPRGNGDAYHSDSAFAGRYSIHVVPSDAGPYHQLESPGSLDGGPIQLHGASHNYHVGVFREPQFGSIVGVHDGHAIVPIL